MTTTSPDNASKTQASAAVNSNTKTHAERRAELEAIFIGCGPRPDTEKLRADIINAPNAVALAMLAGEVASQLIFHAERAVEEIQVEVALCLFCHDAEIGADTSGVDWEDVRTMMSGDLNELVAEFTEEANSGKTEDDEWEHWFPCKEFWHGNRYLLAEAVPVVKRLRQQHGRDYAKTQKKFDIANMTAEIRGNAIYLIATGQRHYDELRTEALRALLLAILDQPLWVSANYFLLSALNDESGVQ